MIVHLISDNKHTVNTCAAQIDGIRGELKKMNEINDTLIRNGFRPNHNNNGAVQMDIDMKQSGDADYQIDDDNDTVMQCDESDPISNRQMNAAQLEPGTPITPMPSMKRPALWLSWARDHYFCGDEGAMPLNFEISWGDPMNFMTGDTPWNLFAEDNLIKALRTAAMHSHVDQAKNVTGGIARMIIPKRPVLRTICQIFTVNDNGSEFERKYNSKTFGETHIATITLPQKQWLRNAENAVEIQVHYKMDTRPGGIFVPDGIITDPFLGWRNEFSLHYLGVTGSRRWFLCPFPMLTRTLLRLRALKATIHLGLFIHEMNGWKSLDHECKRVYKEFIDDCKEHNVCTRVGCKHGSCNKM